jgi:hypothetical protein
MIKNIKKNIDIDIDINDLLSRLSHDTKLDKFILENLTDINGHCSVANLVEKYQKNDTLKEKEIDILLLIFIKNKIEL